MTSNAISILVTGGTGFVGRSVVQRLGERPDFRAVRAVRVGSPQIGGSTVVVGDINAKTDWGAALSGTQVIIHAAARAHIMDDTTADPLTEFRRVNSEGTLNLARQAAEAGVKRFVFISSIKVNGEQTMPNVPFAPTDKPYPEDPYGLSKMEAEQGLQVLAHDTGMEVVIIRPPLVYGPGAKGNFASMVKLIEKGVPLPLGAIQNRRSLVALDNLVDLIVACIDHPDAANQVFLAGDGEDLSTAELLRAVAKAMGKPCRLVPVPAGLLMLGAKLLGKTDIAQRLLGSLQVDISRAREVLGWEPPISVEEGLRRCFPDRR